VALAGTVCYGVGLFDPGCLLDGQKDGKPMKCEETFEKCSILFKVKEGENPNHRNTFSISRIKI
jgi:hypothetical protein